MRVAMAQLNPVVGDLEGNFRKLREAVLGAKGEGVDLAVFPELFLVGYPPKDLLDFGWFLRKTEAAASRVLDLSREVPGTGILFGVPLKGISGDENGLFNTARLVYEGKVLIEQRKSLLPTYDVFDEARYFYPARDVSTVKFKDQVLGISICEDAWSGSEIGQVKRNYGHDPVAELARKGASVFINLSASPFNAGKEAARFGLISGHARKHGVPFLYVNQVGANDELVFDGRSLFVDAKGRPVRVLPAFREAVEIIDTADEASGETYTPQEEIESVHEALTLGVGDYMRKCGFTKAVVGLSGGIDSAVTLCIGERAVGKENVLAVTMPSPFSSTGSVDDSRELAENLGVPFEVVPITGIYRSYLDALGGPFAGTGQDTTEENIQARIRGNILMAFSNKFGHLLLSTGNKSELSTGYCTLYGDMSGGLAVIADVPKTMVYELAEYINRGRPVIPRAIIEKAPSAELRPNQTDQDTLPPYAILDEILSHHIEGGLSAEEIASKGLDPETVRWVVRTVSRNEYKRKQAAPGLRVTTKAFGIGRRMPLAARYWD